MSSIAAAILILGACGSASRTMVVEPSIESILIRVVAGGVKDVLERRMGKMLSVQVTGQNQSNRAWEMPAVSLRIDGQPRTGVLAWAAAAHRVAGYALDRETGRASEPDHGGLAGMETQRTGLRGSVEYAIRDWMPQWLRSNDSGSVEYSYRLTVRGFNVWRTTRITDGRVVLTTDVYGRIGPRGELYHVRLDLLATEVDSLETGHGTRITGHATGWSEIGSRCRIVSRIASRIIGEQLDTELLARIQRGGIDLYRAGGIAEVLR